MDQELNVIVLPNGSLELEWQSAERPVDKSTGILQQEIYNRRIPGEGEWLLFLGFCDKKDDNAHVEQKNRTHIRQWIGYERLDNPNLVHLLNNLSATFIYGATGSVVFHAHHSIFCCRYFQHTFSLCSKYFHIFMNEVLSGDLLIHHSIRMWNSGVSDYRGS